MNLPFSIVCRDLFSMKANEARKIAEAANTANLTDVYNEIKKKAEEGEFTAYVYRIMKPDQIAELESNGFKVQRIDDPGETIYQIDW